MTDSPPLFSKLARGGVVMAGAQVLRLLLRLGSMMTLARLLEPDEFGLFGMAALVYGLLQTVRDLGLGAVAIQQGEQSPSESTLFFWLQMAAGFGAAGVTALAAVPTAAWFGRPELVPVIVTLGAAFAVGGLGGQFRVTLVRSLRFRAISVIDLSGLAAGIVAAVLLATAGRGHWALVWMVLVTEAVTTAGLGACADWRPRGRPDFAGTFTYIRRGLKLSANSIVQYGIHMIDQTLVASRFGAQAVGFYGRAWQLGTLPTHGVFAGLNQWLSQGLVRLRDDPEAFRAWSRQVLNTLLYGCAPLAAVLAVAPETVLRMLLGPGWEPAAPALSWLALTIPAQAWIFLELGILIACRREGRLLLWSAIRLVTLAAVLGIGAPHSLAGVAACVAAAKWLLMPAGLVLVMHSCPLRWRDVAEAVLAPMSLGGFVGVALWGTRSWSATTALPALTLAGVALAAVAVFFAAWPRARRELAAAGRLLTSRRD